MLMLVTITITITITINCKCKGKRTFCFSAFLEGGAEKLVGVSPSVDLMCPGVELQHILVRLPCHCKPTRHDHLMSNDIELLVPNLIVVMRYRFNLHAVFLKL